MSKNTTGPLVPNQEEEMDIEIEHTTTDEQHHHQQQQSSQYQYQSPQEESKEQFSNGSNHNQTQSYPSSPPDTATDPSYHQQNNQHQSLSHSEQPSQSNSRPATSPTNSPQPMFTASSLDAAAHAAIESDDEVVVSQFLQLLEQHREECQQNCMYVEAELAKQKIEELRQHEESRRRSSLAVRHIAERLDMEEAHILEFDEFNDIWNNKILKEFDDVTREKQQAMLMKHVEALEEWTTQKQDHLLLRPKFSKQLLHLRAMQESFARARDYAQAERVKIQANSLEFFELESLKSKWASSIEARRAKFLALQKAELDGYLTRRADERRKLEQRKMTELKNEIIQKYKNLKTELECQQAKERAKMDRMKDLGISGSAFLREQAPKNRNHSGLQMHSYSQTPSTGTSTTPSRPPSNNYGRTRLQSTGFKQRRQIEEEEEAMLRQGEAALDPSHSTNIPTIANTLYPTAPTTHGSQTQRSQPQPPPRATTGQGPSSNYLVGQRGSGSNGATNDSTPHSARPSTSHAYDASGRRQIIPRTHKPISIHYSRPPTSTPTSQERQQELHAILVGGGPGAAGPSAGPLSARRSPRASPTASTLTYLDRLAARQTVSQKTRAGLFKPNASTGGAGLPSLAQARAIQAQREVFAEDQKRRGKQQEKEAERRRQQEEEDEF